MSMQIDAWGGGRGVRGGRGCFHTPKEGAVEGQGAGAAPLQGSAVEQGTLGLLQEAARLFGVTDYSPEWSYPEVSQYPRTQL